MKQNKWIQKAINPAHKGELRKELGVKPGQKIPLKKLEQAASPADKNKKERKQAVLAKTLRELPRKKKTKK